MSRRGWRRLPAAVVATALVGGSALLGPAAHAAEETDTYAVDLPQRATPWTDTVTVPRFDPALGELRAVDVHVESRLDGTVGYENLTDEAVTVEATLAATVTVFRPLGVVPVVSVRPEDTRSDDLDPFDGTIDQAGASGDTHDLNDSAEATVTLTAPLDLALFTGATPITLPTGAVNTSTGPSPLTTATVLDPRVDAEVSVTYTYVTDTRPPDPPTIVTAPGAVTNDEDPDITFTAEPGATTECELDTPTAAGSWASCTSPWTADLSGGDDGTYTFAVRATDPSGNVGSAATRTFLLDRVAPGAPAFTSTPLAATPDTDPVWAFTIEAGATARCAVDGGPPATCSSPFTVDLGAEADGPHTLDVWAVDPASNPGPAATHTFRLDRQRPEPPTITVPAASPSNDPTPTWAFTLPGDAVSATCSVDDGPYLSCTSPVSADLSASGPGTVTDHTLELRSHDEAGNTSDDTVGTYVLDRQAPNPPGISGVTSPSNDRTPQWVITTEPGATTECRLDAGSWEPCTGSYDATFGPGDDGVHLLSVRATDAAGNLGAEATAQLELDTAAPDAPTFTAEPADPSNSPLPTWSFTVEALSQPACSVDDGPWLPCTSPHTVDLQAAADGPHTLSVRTTDEVGNTSEAASSTFVLDRSAPTAPTITSGPASPGNTRSVTWTFSVPEGTTATCRVDLGAIVPCVSSLSTTFATDGIHRFSVLVRDAAGNPSGVAMATYVLDTVAPVAPTITGAPASPSRVTTPHWSFTVEAASMGQCSLDGLAWVACANGFTADLSEAPDGAHTLAVRSVDAAGNVGRTVESTMVLDRTPPPRPVIVSRPDLASADDTPTWGFSVEDGATTECRVDDGTWVACAGAYTADLTGGPDGTHALEVRATDALGNVSVVAVSAYELDRTPPATPAFTSSPLPSGNDPSPVWTFTFEPGTTAWCSVDGQAPDGCPGTYQPFLGQDGTHTFTVVVVDAAGNRSPERTSTYALDTTPPAVPVVAAPPPAGNDRSPEWRISVEPGAVAECSLDGGALAPCGGLFTLDLPGDDGAHTLEVIAEDDAGNVSAAHRSTYVLDTAPPAPPVITHTPDDDSWTWAFRLEAGASGECSIDGGPWTPCASGLPGGVSGRTVRFEVRAVDQAANRSPVTGVTRTPTRVIGPVDPPPPPPVPPGEGGPPPAPQGAGPTVTPPPVVAGPDLAPRPTGEGLDSPGAPPGRYGAPTRRDPAAPFGGVVRDLLQAAAENTTIPALVVVLVIAFVAAQNRIDRRDPKLANAPLRHEPEYLEFK